VLFSSFLYGCINGAVPEVLFVKIIKFLIMMEEKLSEIGLDKYISVFEGKYCL